MINKLIELSAEEIKLIRGGVNNKQITWRIFQIMFVSGYICYKTYLAIYKANKISGNQDKRE